MPHGAHGMKGASGEGGYVDLKILTEAEVEMDGAFNEVTSVVGMEKESALKDGVDQEGEIEIPIRPKVTKRFDIVGVWQFPVGEVKFE